MTGLLRVLVTGSRAWTDSQALGDALLDCWHDAVQLGADGITVVHGAADGADSLADLWAVGHRGLGVLREPTPADWPLCAAECRPEHRRLRRDGSEYCPTAGHRRNQLMVDRGAAVCVGFWRAPGTGTLDCLRRAERAGIPVRRIDAS
jgi:hypothetical protein